MGAGVQWTSSVVAERSFLLFERMGRACRPAPIRGKHVAIFLHIFPATNPRPCQTLTLRQCLDPRRRPDFAHARGKHVRHLDLGGSLLTTCTDWIPILALLPGMPRITAITMRLSDNFLQFWDEAHRDGMTSGIPQERICWSRRRRIRVGAPSVGVQKSGLGYEDFVPPRLLDLGRVG